jgi:hypothetical protein
MKYISYIFVLAALLVWNCGGTSKEDEKLLKAAAAIHNAAFDLAGELEAKLGQLKGDTLLVSDSVNALLGDIEKWESEMVEVPGNETHGEHAEGETHHHHHEHGKALEMTPSQLLVVQQEMKTQLDAIAVRVSSLTKTR